MTEADHLRVRVANTGPGILLAEQGRVFERFYRADKSRSHCVEGVGLGLSLSREFLRAHGGEISLDRSESELAVFSVTLPKGRVGTD